MRGKKSYNIRNIEAHITNSRDTSFRQQSTYNQQFSNTIGRNIIFPTNNNLLNLTNVSQRQNEYINAKFGVSKYASNLVSGKMFKII